MEINTTQPDRFSKEYWGNLSKFAGKAIVFAVCATAFGEIGYHRMFVSDLRSFSLDELESSKLLSTAELGLTLVSGYFVFQDVAKAWNRAFRREN